MSTRTKRSSKRSFAAVVAAALIASVLALVAAPASAATPITVTTRSTLSGTDRYGTSEKIHTATNAKTAVTDLVIASGDSFPDALAALALVEKVNAGMVLVPKDGTLSAAAVAKAVAATNVYIIGGTSAVSSAVETKLKTVTTAGGAGKAAANVIRYAGADRYSTAAIVANAITTGDVVSYNLKKTALLVSGENFADAVSASMLVSGPAGSNADDAHPILLTQANSLPAATEVALQNLGIKRVVIIGGTAAVSSAVETTLKASYSVTRIAGTDRFDTAAKVADLAVKSVATGGFGMNKREVYLAEMGPASGGADALAAGQLVNIDGSVLLGTSGGELPAATSAWLAANPAGTTGLTLSVIGGTGVIPAATVDAAKTAAGGAIAPLTATITGTVGQKGYTIQFSEAVLKSTCAIGDAVHISVSTGADVAITGCTWPGTTAAQLTASTLYVTTNTALVKGDTMRLLAGTITTADGRTHLQMNGTVAGDTTSPVTTIGSVLSAAGTVVTVTFDELVYFPNVMADGDMKYNGVAETVAPWDCATYVGTTAVEANAGCETLTAAAGSAFNKIVMTRATALAPGSSLMLMAGVVRDLAAATNANAQTTVTFTQDLVVPKVAGSPVVTTAAGAKATYAIVGAGGDGIMLTAVSAGAAGNGKNVIVTSTTNQATTGCTVAGANITIDVANSGDTADETIKDAVKLINATAACKALVVASAIGADSGLFDSADVASAAMSGGTDVHTVTVAFSEAMGANGTGFLAGALSWDGDGAGGDCTAVASTVATTTVTGSSVTVAFTSPDPDCAVAIGTSAVNVVANKAGDLAGNFAAADSDGDADNLAVAG